MQSKTQNFPKILWRKVVAVFSRLVGHERVSLSCQSFLSSNAGQSYFSTFSIIQGYE